MKVLPSGQVVVALAKFLKSEKGKQQLAALQRLRDFVTGRAAVTKEPSLICGLCEADRTKEPCRGGNITKCPISGTAQGE